MKVAAFLRSLASGLFRRSQMEGEMDEELRAHIANRADDLERSGLSHAEAERRARIEFGGQERYKEECREERGGAWLESLWTDVRFGLRMLVKSRGFSALAVLTLALGIGANAAIFSMVNALLLHPYHFRDLDVLVRVWEDRGIDEGYDARYVAPADATELSTHNEIFENVTTYEMRSNCPARRGHTARRSERLHRHRQNYGHIDGHLRAGRFGAVIRRGIRRAFGERCTAHSRNWNSPGAGGRDGRLDEIDSRPCAEAYGDRVGHCFARFFRHQRRHGQSDLRHREYGCHDSSVVRRNS
jgi:hypothetical protein